MVQETVVDRIAAGTAELLSIGRLCVLLGVSRTTFERLQKRKVNPFPRYDIRIAGGPRWEMETFKAWLAKNTAPIKE